MAASVQNCTNTGASNSVVSIPVSQLSNPRMLKFSASITDMALVIGFNICPTGSLKSEDGTIYSVSQLDTQQLNDQEKAHILFYQKLAYDLIHVKIPESNNKELASQKGLHDIVEEYRKQMAGDFFDIVGPYFEDYNLYSGFIDQYNKLRNSYKIDIFDGRLVSSEIWEKHLSDPLFRNPINQLFGRHYLLTHTLITQYCSRKIAEAVCGMCLDQTKTLPDQTKTLSEKLIVKKNKLGMICNEDFLSLISTAFAAVPQNPFTGSFRRSWTIEVEPQPAAKK